MSSPMSVKCLRERAKTGDLAELKIDRVRRARIRANHSATHLLHAALRNRLGRHVSQKGSLVEDDYFRFDFSHPAPLTRDDIDAVEDEVNAVIRQNAPAEVREMSPEAAVKAGALALFGEKYGEIVRVLRLGNSPTEANAPYSVELCGGTHVGRTGDIAVFVVTGESGVSSGIRRIEGATGAAALAFLKARASVAREIADQLKSPIPDAPARVAALSDQRRKLEQDLADARRKLAMGGGGAASGPEEVGGRQVHRQDRRGRGGERPEVHGRRSEEIDGLGRRRVRRRNRWQGGRRRRRHRRPQGEFQRG